MPCLWHSIPFVYARWPAQCALKCLKYLHFWFSGDRQSALSYEDADDLVSEIVWRDGPASSWSTTGERGENRQINFHSFCSSWHEQTVVRRWAELPVASKKKEEEKMRGAVRTITNNAASRGNHSGQRTRSLATLSTSDILSGVLPGVGACNKGKIARNAFHHYATSV